MASAMPKRGREEGLKPLGYVPQRLKPQFHVSYGTTKVVP